MSRPRGGWPHPYKPGVYVSRQRIHQLKKQGSPSPIVPSLSWEEEWIRQMTNERARYAQTEKDDVARVDRERRAAGPTGSTAATAPAGPCAGKKKATSHAA